MAQGLSRNRIVLGLFGSLAGLALWALVDAFEPEMTGARPRLALTALLAGFATAVLALSGPLGLRPALIRALPLAALAASLLFLAALRFDTPGEMLRAGHPLVAWAALIVLAMPYLVAAAGAGAAPGGWRHYPALFAAAWSIVMRLVTAWLFVAVFWIVFFLSHALLSLVGVTLLADLADRLWFVFTASGLVLGVAMAVLNEYASALSPVLVLRLLRLLLPVLTGVVCLFLVLIPLRGLAALDGAFLVGGTLLMIALAGITLISAALDEDDDCATDSRFLRNSARALALLLPLVAGLAAWHIGLRIDAYGLTPARLGAATAAAVTLIYALAYAASVLRGAGWMARIRRANTGLALLVLALCAAWLSPALNAEWLSARHQMARFADGRVTAEKLDLWSLAHDFGRPGRSAIDRLRGVDDHPEAATLAARLARLADAPDRYTFEHGSAAQALEPALRADIAARIRLRPEGAGDAAALLAGVSAGRLEDIARGCDISLDDGGPACAIRVLTGVEGWSGPQALLVYARTTGIADAVFLTAGATAGERAAVDLAGRLRGLTPERAIGALLDGRIAATTPRQPALLLDGAELFPLP